MKRLATAALGFALAGCFASGFDRGDLRSRLEQGAPTAPTSTQGEDADIRAALELQPALSLPFRLAVYLTDTSISAEGTFHHGPGLRGGTWRWDGKDKELLLSVAEQLRTEGILSDMFLLSPARVAAGNLRGIRLAAAQHGADAVLVVTGAEDTDCHANLLSLLYLTIVGSWIVPGTHADAIFLMDGAMWDVRNQYLYLSAEAEGLASRVRPIALLDEEEVIGEAKTRAVELFVPELLERLRAIGGEK